MGVVSDGERPATPGRRTSPAMVALAVLAWFGILVGCGIAAGHLLAGAEGPHGGTPFDRSITMWLVHRRTGALTPLARTLSTLGSQKVLTPLVVLVVLVLVDRRRVAPAAALVAAWGGAIVLYALVKQAIGRPRPPERLWLQHPGGTSFPSGHAVQSLSTLLAFMLVWLWVVRPVRGAAAAATTAIVLSAAVAWSRVYLGVHWTTDVIAGLLLAAAWIGLFVAMLRRRV